MPMQCPEHEPEKVYLPLGEKDGLMVPVWAVPSGLACGCVCPFCRTPLIARKGNIRQHHFAHYNHEECAHAVETAFHKLAKQVIAEEKRIGLPAVDAMDAHGTMTEIAPAMVLAVEDVFEENRFGSFVPDLTVRCQGKPLLVEIEVTHGVDTEKLNKIIRLGVSALLIDLSRHLRVLDMEAIKDDLLGHGSHKRWLYNAKAKAYQKSHQQATLRRINRWNRQAVVWDCPLPMAEIRSKSFSRVDEHCAHCLFYHGQKNGHVICSGKARL